MSEYWLISVPANGNAKREFSALQQTQASEAASSSLSNLVLPKELKVGTLDTLIGLSDDLVKIDSFVESVVFKLIQYISELSPPAAQGRPAPTLLETLKVGGKTLSSYVASFGWESAKFNTALPVRQIADDLSKRVSAVESDMKSKFGAYSKAKSNLQAAERKAAGSLLTRSLDELVRKEHFVHESEYLTTLLVVIPLFSVPEWLDTYATLTEILAKDGQTKLVVPNSSEKVTADNEYALYTVTVFQRAVDDFKLKAREKRFIVRDFTYDANQAQTAVQEKKELQDDYKKKHEGLSIWCVNQFSEVFSCFVHVKALRLFVESVLRYGLPVDIMCAVLEVKQKSQKRLRTMLEGKYSSLKTLGSGSEKDTAGIKEIAGVVASSQKDYYPYVNFTIDISKLLQLS
eukprot:m.105193 g.105193  ORF g.105193 m.105193 type:complete len:403 (+) comp51634_c0_seq1:43-1251(+)